MMYLLTRSSLLGFLLSKATIFVGCQEAHQNTEYYHYDPIFAAEDSLTETCDVYLAPSKIGGWGVYAGRDFEENEVVEIAPRYIALRNDWLGETVMDDYHYGFTFQTEPSEMAYGAVIFGKGMFYNHGPGDKQNVIYTNFGREPDRSMPWAANILGYVAKKPIKRGEELLCTYGDGQWFIDRGIEIKEQPKFELPTLSEMQKLEQKYCSNVVAGIGHSTWVHRMSAAQEISGFAMPDFDYQSRLPLQNHPTAIAKAFVKEGEILEMSPALVVPADQMQASPLSPMVFYWGDLDNSHKESIRQLREMGAYRMKGISNVTGDVEIDILEFFDDSSILPAGGNIALVRRVGDDDPNCRMEIIAPADTEEELDLGSAGVVLKLIATKDIQSGEELRLNIPDNSSWDSKMSLQQHLALLGLPIPRHLVETFNDNIRSLHNEEDEEEIEPEF